MSDELKELQACIQLAERRLVQRRRRVLDDAEHLQATWRRSLEAKRLWLPAAGALLLAALVPALTRRLLPLRSEASAHRSGSAPVRTGVLTLLLGLLPVLLPSLRLPQLGPPLPPLLGLGVGLLQRWLRNAGTAPRRR